MAKALEKSLAQSSQNSSQAVEPAEAAPAFWRLQTMPVDALMVWFHNGAKVVRKLLQRSWRSDVVG